MLKLLYLTIKNIIILNIFWSENIIVEINEEDILPNQYVFKKFGIKQIEVMKNIK